MIFRHEAYWSSVFDSAELLQFIKKGLYDLCQEAGDIKIPIKSSVWSLLKLSSMNYYLYFLSQGVIS